MPCNGKYQTTKHISNIYTTKQIYQIKKKYLMLNVTFGNQNQNPEFARNKFDEWDDDYQTDAIYNIHLKITNSVDWLN